MTRQLSIAFQTDKTPGEYIALAKLVDRYEFDVVSVYCDAPFHPAYGPLLLMAPHLRRARIGPAAVSPARIAPIDISAETALLAGIAAGGVYIGLARGAWLADHGIREPDQPVQAIREAAAIIRLLLAGESGGYEGAVFRLAPHVRAPYPLPDAPIPLLIGTWGRRLGVLAGQIADEVKIGGSANPDMIPVMRGYLAQGEAQAGRAPGAVGVVIGAVSVIDSDRDQARAAARRAVSLYLPVVAPLDPTLTVDPGLIARVQDCVNRRDGDAAARLISDELLDRFAFSGSPADILRQSEALFAAGASRIEFGTPHGLKLAEGIRLLGERVLPALRGPYHEP